MEKVTLLVVGICTGFLIYFGVCGFYGEIPFNKGFEIEAVNSSCGDSLQVKGYCCKSVEQFNTGDCTK
jgi:hypothetical protein